MCNHFEAWYYASDGPWSPIPLIFTRFSPPISQTVSQSMTTSMKSLSCFGSDRPSCCSTAAGLSCIFIRRMSLYAWLQSSALLQGGCYSCCGMRLVLMQRLNLAGLTDVQSEEAGQNCPDTTGCHLRSLIQVCSAEPPTVDLQHTYTTTQDQSWDRNKSYTRMVYFRLNPVAVFHHFMLQKSTR